MVEDINISLNNLGTINKNCVSISTELGKINLWFSYETLVGVDEVVSVNEWGKTTGKLLNELQDDKKQRIPHEEVLKESQKRLKKLFYTTREIIAQNL